jgi:hypothetical protein
MPGIEAQPPHKHGGPYFAWRFCDEIIQVQQMTES